MAPIRQARVATPLSLLEMNREQAQIERDRMADEYPELTWLIAEPKPGEWAVVKVGLTPTDAEGSATEERAKPDYAEDPRQVTEVNRGGNWVAGG
jgi:hypothetical protein